MIRRFIYTILIVFMCITPVMAAEATSDIVDDFYDLETKTILAKVVWGEARGIKSQTEQSAVIWTILNRCDAWDREILDVALQPKQFAYNKNNKTVDDFGRDLIDLVSDVLSRWKMDGEGRTLPKEYLYFGGHKGHNWFRIGYYDKTYWDWSLESPYDN